MQENIIKNLAFREINLVLEVVQLEAELDEFKAILEYDPALKELFEETQAKMKGTNAWLTN